MREHLGLLHPDDPFVHSKNGEILPEGNVYDWGSKEDDLVKDPLGDDLWKLIMERAKTNTEAFKKVFRCLPDDDGTAFYSH
jgi:phospholipase D1/2